MQMYVTTVPVDEQWLTITHELAESAPSLADVEPAIPLQSSADWGQEVSLEVQVYELEEIPTVPAGVWHRDTDHRVTVSGGLQVSGGSGRCAGLPEVAAGDYDVTTWVTGRSENAEAVAAWERTLPTGEAADVQAPDCSERWIVQLQRRTHGA